MIAISIATDPNGKYVLTATDRVQVREVRTLNDVKLLLSDRGASLTETQHHGLGIMTSLIALQEFAGRYRTDQLAKVLDSIYFGAVEPAAGREFSRGMGMATSAIRSTVDLEGIAESLVEDAQRDFSV